MGFDNMSIGSGDSGSRCPIHASSELELSTLPLEIRLLIYNYVFTRDDINVSSDLERVCGQGLSATDRFFYRETRSRYYGCAEFGFCSPLVCKRFLDIIGIHISNLRNLAVTFKFSDAHILQSIFKRASKIQTLRLNYTSHHDEVRPVYLPSVRREDPSIENKIRLRPASHSLSKLKSIRKLTVLGLVKPREIQRAILKLGLKMMEVAGTEGKSVIESTTLDAYTSHRQPRDRYEIEILNRSHD
ncbi:uncharacterized protein L3040_000116 [Drepanopeziza brunnea f. sp. 'multigermtubi']|nr:hypothetical protein L3040_000116 [Drepanopeziza brunnea f. sp. 'multigermtubi']